MDNKLRKAIAFSQIYGTRAEVIENLVTKEGQRKLTLDFIHKFPKSVYVIGLRKLKARAMIEALIEGEYDKGNHVIRYANYTYGFYYRGTLIYTWDAEENYGLAQDAGEFEDTPSTKNQREEIKKAIENFNEIVFKL